MNDFTQYFKEQIDAATSAMPVFTPVIETP